MIRYKGSVVRIQGKLGTVVGWKQRFDGVMEYEVKFDAGHGFGMDVWLFEESVIQKSMLHGWKQPKCECGAETMKDSTPYSHAQWCSKWKRGPNE